MADFGCALRDHAIETAPAGLADWFDGLLRHGALIVAFSEVERNTGKFRNLLDVLLLLRKLPRDNDLSIYEKTPEGARRFVEEEVCRDDSGVLIWWTEKEKLFVTLTEDIPVLCNDPNLLTNAKQFWGVQTHIGLIPCAPRKTKWGTRHRSAFWLCCNLNSKAIISVFSESQKKTTLFHTEMVVIRQEDSYEGRLIFEPKVIRKCQKQYQLLLELERNTTSEENNVANGCVIF